MKKVISLFMLLCMLCTGAWAQTPFDTGRWQEETTFTSDTQDANGVRYYDMTVTLNTTDIYVYYRYSSGSHALTVKRVELRANNEVISYDEHDNASTGNAKNHCTFKLNVREAGTYTLRTYAKGDGGWATNGDIYCYTQEDVNSIFTSIKGAISNRKVGYPKAGTDLANNITNYDIDGGQYTQLCDYIFSACNNNIANTQIPESGKAYKLSFFNYEKNKTHYITYSNGELGLSVNEGDAATILFTQVQADPVRYIGTLSDGNIIAWRGDSNEGYKIDGASSKGYSAMVANQSDKDDWNLCWFQKQSSTASELGTIKMISRRGASSTSCWVIISTNSPATWAKADETSFPNSNNKNATSALQFEEVAGVTGETAGYKDGVEKYTIYTTAKTNSETYASYFGEGLGKYHFTDKNAAEQTAGYMDAVKACTTLDQERSVVNSITINQPEDGFYRFKGHINGRYITATHSSYENHLGLPATRANNNTEVFYVQSIGEGKYKILNYYDGRYWNENNVAAIGGEAGQFSFQQALNNSSKNLVGEYWIQTNNSHNDILQPWNNGDPQISIAHKNIDDQSGWDIEKVTELPISLAEIEGHHYGTMYSPVAIDLSELVGMLKAYAVEVNGDKAEMISVGEVVPANTAVVLYADRFAPIAVTLGGTSTYDGTNALQGVLATTNTIPTGGVMTMQNVSESGIGFYSFSGNTLKGFKAYLPKTKIPGVTAFSFNFEEEQTTAIVNAIAAQNAGAAYDITGRQVRANAKGISIMNGAKVIR